MAIALVVLAAACSSPGPGSTSPGRGSTSPTTSPRPSASDAGSAVASPTATPGAAPTPVDLAAHPRIWFAPLPPLPTGPGRPFIGSEDFMGLFAAGAPWETAASRIGVFKLYGEWVAYAATDAELRTAVQDIARRGMVLAVEMGPLDPPADCGSGVESFAGTTEGRLISRRIRAAGGTLGVVALDEPYYFAHVYDGPNACHWSVEQVAQGVASFRDVMRAEWPAILIGDTEPMPAPVTPDGLADWLDTYRRVAGEPLAFLHLDMDWSIRTWSQLALAVQAVGTARGVPIGIIYNGGSAASDAQWIAVTGRRVDAYEAQAGAHPDQVLFQSWMDKPDHVLPETDASTFTWLIDAYVDDPASLAHLGGGADNVAFGRPVTASSAIAGSPPGGATDGDPESIWNSGTFAPAWVEIDLGQVYPISDIRLLVSQSPNGATSHEVGCRTKAGGALTPIATVHEATTDGELIDVPAPPGGTLMCRFIRVDTTSSPSWVAWREIEVSSAP